MKEIIINIIDVFIPFGLSVAAVYLNLLLRKLKTKAESEIEKIENEKAEAVFKAAVDKVDILAEKTVAALEQTTAAEIRRRIKEGNATKEDLTEACEGACFNIYSELKPEYAKVIKDSYSDISEYIQKVIEEKLLRLKGELYGNND